MDTKLEETCKSDVQKITEDLSISTAMNKLVLDGYLEASDVQNILEELCILAVMTDSVSRDDLKTPDG